MLLKNGGMVRGTISELDPDDTVTIVTVTGVQRRIDMSGVRYAGPADNAPAPDEEPRAPPKVEAPAQRTPTRSYSFQSDEIPFTFVSRQSELTLYIRDRGFTPICTAPCDGKLPAGAHQLALSFRTSRPVALPELTRLSGRSTLRGSYVSNKDTRTVGWTVFGASIAVGTILSLVGVSQGAKDCLSNRCDRDDTLTIAGVITALGGGGLGLALGLRFDEPILTVTEE